MHRPAVQFYTGDWKKDPAVTKCGPATRGIWFDLLCSMIDAETYYIDGSLEALARAGRCSEEEMRVALIELATQNAALVIEGCVRDLSGICPGFVRDLSAQIPGDFRRGVTVVSRRLAREIEARNAANERKKKERERKAAARVTPSSRESHAPSSSSSSDLSSKPEQKLSLARGESGANGHSRFGPNELTSLWFNRVRKSPSGNFETLVRVAERIERSAELFKADVHEHAERLAAAFVDLIAGWRDANRPAPQPSVDAFERNFVACEEVVSGERNPKALAAARASPSRGFLPPRPPAPQTIAEEL